MDESNLTEEQKTSLARFQEFSGISSVETSIHYLSAHNWNVEEAVNTALATNSDLPTPNRQINTPLFCPQPQTTVDSTVAVRSPRFVASQILRLPLSFLYTLYTKIQRFLPERFVRSVFLFVRSIFWKESQRDPLRELEEYRTYFNRQYGTRHPTFYCGTLSQALRDAQREIRLLFVYLHDKNSVLCDRFCREVFCEDTLSSIIGNNLVWSASRDTKEGLDAIRLLNVIGFPCLCIIAHRGSQQNVQFKLERYTDPSECLAEIIDGMQNADQALQYNREQRNKSDSRSRLLKEQNDAYLDSVRADKEKAEQRQREDDERRKIEEEQRTKLQVFTEFREHLKDKLPAEPSSMESETIQISIRLPANEPMRRRFRRKDSAKCLFEFAWTNPNVPNQFKLLWGYPRKPYQYEEISEETIGDLMSGSTETCYLEEMDEDK